MSEPGGTGPDWAAIFDRAHRHLGRRLLLLGAIGAGGAVLLLSGGLTANGTIKVFSPTESKAEKHEPKPPGKGRGHGPQQSSNDPGKPPGGGHRPKATDNNGSDPKPPRGKPVCQPEVHTSAGLEYQDCPPTSPDGSANSGDEGEEPDDTAASEKVPSAP